MNRMRTKKGFLTDYAMACGYHEQAEHPTDKECWVQMKRAAPGFYQVEFRVTNGVVKLLYSGSKIGAARKVWLHTARTIVVAQALEKAGVT